HTRFKCDWSSDVCSSDLVFTAAGTLPVNNVNNGFEVNAIPSTWQTTGVRSFCDDQTGVLKFDVSGAAAGLAAGSCQAVLTAAGKDRKSVVWEGGWGEERG